MEHISEVITQQKAVLDKARQTALPTANWSATPQQQSQLWQQRGEIVRQRFGDDVKFKQIVNPDTQVNFGENQRMAIMGDYPTLRDIETAYGTGFAAEWLLPHIANLSVFCGAKNLNIAQEKELARIIAAEHKCLKITEVLLFFYWFKSGKYGRFYGSVEPMAITCALREFLKERNILRSRYEEELN